MSNILNPVREITLGAGRIEVRQMPFVQAIEFIKRLSVVASRMFDDHGRFKLSRAVASPAEPLPVIDPELARTGVARLATPTEVHMAFDFDAIQKVIAESADLTEFLILHSTRQDAAWLKSLSLLEGLTILEAALDLNLSPEVLRLGNEVAGALTRLQRKKTAPAKPSSSASIS
ncbi:MAG TPA: hypothetical protein VHB20_14690 [Verrucomicrobiae bacterium]|jgi:hypothetical protein|nr:hypothetical protein [Verrucomicrobiae bacterium]